MLTGELLIALLWAIDPNEGEGERGRGGEFPITNPQLPMPNAQCPMPNDLFAQFPMPNAQ